MFFLILVLVPVLRRPEYKSIFSRLFQNVGRRFRTVGWVSLLVLLFTGVTNLLFRGYSASDILSGRVFQGSFGHILLQKLIIVVLIFIISIVHDFWIGPKASALMRQGPGSPEALMYRKAATWLGRVNFILAILVVALAVLLVRGGF